MLLSEPPGTGLGGGGGGHSRPSASSPPSRGAGSKGSRQRPPIPGPNPGVGARPVLSKCLATGLRPLGWRVWDADGRGGGGGGGGAGLQSARGSSPGERAAPQQDRVSLATCRAHGGGAGSCQERSGPEEQRDCGPVGPALPLPHPATQTVGGAGSLRARVLLVAVAAAPSTAVTGPSARSPASLSPLLRLQLVWRELIRLPQGGHRALGD